MSVAVSLGELRPVLWADSRDGTSRWRAWEGPCLRRYAGCLTVGSFTMEGERNVFYWIAPARWGQGLASRALRAFLAIERTRPLYGRGADHNVASAKVLARAGLVKIGSETSFAPGVGAEVVEHTYRLDQ